MKSLRRAILATLLAVLALAGRAHAQLDIQPSALTLHGERRATPSRTLSISTTTAKKLTCVLRELVALRSDKSEVVLPPRDVQFSCPETLEVGAPHELSFRVDLKDARSGEYNGELVLTTIDPVSSVRGQHKVPIKVRVRDRWPLPVLLLVISVLASVGVSVYSTSGKPRDELLVRLGPVRAAVQSDRELGQTYASAFADLFAQRIGEVEQALLTAQWGEAQQALVRVEVALARWNRFRRAWVELLRKVEDCRTQVGRAGDSYPDQTAHWLVLLVERATQAETPAALREALEKFTNHLPELLALRQLLGRLSELAEAAEPEQRAVAQARGSQLEQQFMALAPDDLVAARELRGRIEAALREVTLQTQTRGAASRGADLPSASGPAPAPLETANEPPPSVSPSRHDVEKAVLRQRSYTWLGYLMTVSVLAAIGYQELYENNALFGARGLADYLTVLLWGFGTEATRASVFGTVSGWGLPGMSGRPAK